MKPVGRVGTICHPPRKRGIQYAAASRLVTGAPEYWIARSSRAMTAVARRVGVQPTPSALSLRCNAERSMPTNSAVREMLPEKRLIWAIK